LIAKAVQWCFGLVAKDNDVMTLVNCSTLSAKFYCMRQRTNITSMDTSGDRKRLLLGWVEIEHKVYGSRWDGCKRCRNRWD